MAFVPFIEFLVELPEFLFVDVKQENFPLHGTQSQGKSYKESAKIDTEA